MLKRIIWSGLLTLVVISLQAQDTEKNTIENVFKGTRFINGQSANLASEGDLLLQIQHRFGDISQGMYEFFGLDQANMRLGFEYGFTKNFTAGIGRSNFFKTYDASVKFRLVQQADNFPFTAVVSAGGSVPTVRNSFPEAHNSFSDKFSWDAQLHLAKTIGILGLQLSPGYLRTGYLLTENNSFEMATLGFGGSVKLAKKVSLNVEYLHPFEDKLTTKDPLSFGIDLATGGHLFQLLFTNSQGMFNQALYTNAYGGDWTKGHIFFGFNLIRKFKLKYTDEDYY